MSRATLLLVVGAVACAVGPGPGDPTPESEPLGPAGMRFGPDVYHVDPERPSDPEPREGWCEVQPTADPGIAPPPVAYELLHGSFGLDPDAVTCPDATFETWPPFVRRHTAGYTATSSWGGFDQCVPQIDFEGRYGGVRIMQTPLVTANFGVVRYGDILRGVAQDAGWTTDPTIASECPDPVAGVVAQAQWLDDHAVSRPFDGVETWSWGYGFDNPTFGVESGWSSGYAQGLVAAAYVAAFCASGDAQWLDGAEKAMSNLLVPLADGGTATWAADDALWMEEYADEGAESLRVLNGHLGAMAGLWAVGEWTGSDEVATLVQLGANAALRELDRYDAGFISLYAQDSHPFPYIAPKHDYNRFHVQELAWLYDLTGDARALDAALRFARYDDLGMNVQTSPTEGGTEDFWENLAYFPRWWTRAPGWLTADLGRTQVVDGVVLWTPDPSAIESGEVLRPSTVDIDVSTNGVFWDTHTRAWPDRCNDATFDIPPTDARYVKVWLHSPNRQEQPHVGLRSFGVRRVSGSPVGVAQWQNHGVANRPSLALTDDGYVFSRVGWQVFDLDDAFPTGFELLLEGWRGPDDPLPSPEPVVTTADTLDGPWTPIEVAPRMIGPYLAYQVIGDPGFRYVRLEIDSRFNPLAPGKLFVRSL